MTIAHQKATILFGNTKRQGKYDTYPDFFFALLTGGVEIR